MQLKKQQPQNSHHQRELNVRFGRLHFKYSNRIESPSFHTKTKQQSQDFISKEKTSKSSIKQSGKPSIHTNTLFMNSNVIVIRLSFSFNFISVIICEYFAQASFCFYPTEIRLYIVNAFNDFKVPGSLSLSLFCSVSV